MVIKGYDVVALAKKTWSEIGKDRISVYAAQMAYNFFFSLFPLILFLAAMLSLVADKNQVMSWFNTRMGSILSPEVATLIEKTIAAVVFAKGAPALLSFGLVTAAWSGSSVFGSFLQALNAAYEVEETRPWWKRYALQLGALVVAGIVVLGATVILLNGEGIVQWIGDRVGIGHAAVMIWTIIQFPIAIGALVGLLWLLYLYLPNCRHQGKEFVLVGAIVATVLWLIATLLFRLYVQKFHALNPAYGTIGAIMVLLTWMYYSSFVLLAAGELSSELQQGTGKVGAKSAAQESNAQRSRDAEATGRRTAPGAPAFAARRDEQRHEQHDTRDTRPANDHERASARRESLVVAAERRDDEPRSLGTLIRDLASGSVLLVRRELDLARVEIHAIVGAVSRGTAMVATGGVLALLGFLALITGVVLLVGDQWIPRDRYWLAAIIVSVLAGAIAAWMAWRARAFFSSAIPIPRETIESLRADKAAVSAALARGSRPPRGEPAP